MKPHDFQPHWTGVDCEVCGLNAATAGDKWCSGVRGEPGPLLADTASELLEVEDCIVPPDERGPDAIYRRVQEMLSEIRTLQGELVAANNERDMDNGIYVDPEARLVTPEQVSGDILAAIPEPPAFRWITYGTHRHLVRTDTFRTVCGYRYPPLTGMSPPYDDVAPLCAMCRRMNRATP